MPVLWRGVLSQVSLERSWTLNVHKAGRRWSHSFQLWNQRYSSAKEPCNIILLFRLFWFDKAGRWKRASLWNNHCLFWADLGFKKTNSDWNGVSQTITISFGILCFQIGEHNPQLQKITDILDSIKEKVNLITVYQWLIRSLISPEFSYVLLVFGVAYAAGLEVGLEHPWPIERK